MHNNEKYLIYSFCKIILCEFGIVLVTEMNKNPLKGELALPRDIFLMKTFASLSWKMTAA